MRVAPDGQSRLSNLQALPDRPSRRRVKAVA
jgi:hypothetical protein